MMLALWSCAGIELFNNNRGIEGNNAWGCNSFIDPESCGDQFGDAYTPPTDPFWKSDSEPKWADFFGFVVAGVQGLSGPAGVLREYDLLARDYGLEVGSFRRMQRQPRDIKLTISARGKTCCATEYGIKALINLLMDCCGDSCKGTCLRIFNQCSPEPMDEYVPPVLIGNDEDTPVLTSRFDWTWLNISNVALIEGPIITSEVNDTRCCGCNPNTIFEITLRALDPQVWSDKRRMLKWELDDEVPCNTDHRCNSCSGPPVINPFCPGLPDLPKLPQFGSCNCDPPVAKRNRIYFDAPKSIFGTYGTFEISTKAYRLQNVTIRWWDALNGVDKSSLRYRACNACNAINISYIPPYSTIQFGVNGAMLKSPGNVISRADSLVSALDEGNTSSKFSCGPKVMEILWNASTQATDATLDLYLTEARP